MKSILLLAALALVGAASAHAQNVQKSPAECGVAPLGKYMNLSIQEFDQGPDGWRSIGNAKEGCDLAAAGIIAKYRERVLDQVAQLEWHEAQGRAFGGQTAQALELFRRSLAYQLSQTGDYRSDAMILQAEAHVAFFENDLPRLQQARAKLAALPLPEDFARSVASFKEAFPGREPPKWPLNLDQVDGLIQCFGKPYVEANRCRS